MKLWIVCCLVVVSFLSHSDSAQNVGRLINCPGHKSFKTGVDLHATWSPNALKPNTDYVINGQIIINKDIEEVYESATIWLPGKKEPFYEDPEKKVTCTDGNIMEALKFLNVTCPFKKGYQRTITDMHQFLPGTEAAITGTFRVEARLRDKNHNELGCFTANITISN